MNYTSKSVVRVDRQVMWNDSLRVFYYRTEDDDGTQKVYLAATGEMKEITDAAVERSPTFSLRMEEGQQLMDELWRCGLRPTEGTGSAGAMAAVQAHLADMRKLVFTEREQGGT